MFHVPSTAVLAVPCAKSGLAVQAEAAELLWRSAETDAKCQLALNWGECCLCGVVCRLNACVTVCADCVVRGELNNFSG